MEVPRPQKLEKCPKSNPTLLIQKFNARKTKLLISVASITNFGEETLAPLAPALPISMLMSSSPLGHDDPISFSTQKYWDSPFAMGRLPSFFVLNKKTSAVPGAALAGRHVSGHKGEIGLAFGVFFLANDHHQI